MPVTGARPLVGRVRELAQFSTEGFGRRVLADTGAVRVVVAALEDGQEIPLHAPPLDLVMTIVEGVGEVAAAEDVHPVRAGDVVVVPAGETRGLRALGGPLLAVNVVSPPPGPDDHDHEPVAWPATASAPEVAKLILDEHAGLFPHLAHLGHLAAKSETLSSEELRDRLDGILGFLRDGLLPHAEEEERSVYPAAEQVLRAVGGATRTMSIDHRSVRARIDDLDALAHGPLGPHEREAARRLLYGLEALLEVHFTKENEVYVPLLDRLSPAERVALHARLSGEHAHGEHHHQDEEINR